MGMLAGRAWEIGRAVQNDDRVLALRLARCWPESVDKMAGGLCGRLKQWIKEDETAEERRLDAEADARFDASLIRGADKAEQGTEDPRSVQQTGKQKPVFGRPETGKQQSLF